MKLTAMPQMVALFNGVGGGAIALIAWVELSAGFFHEPAYVAVAAATAEPACVAGMIVGASGSILTNLMAKAMNRSIPAIDESKSVIVLKRSMRPGFAGVDNELYYNPKTKAL